MNEAIFAVRKDDGAVVAANPAARAWLEQEDGTSLAPADPSISQIAGLDGEQPHWLRRRDGSRSCLHVTRGTHPQNGAQWIVTLAPVSGDVLVAGLRHALQPALDEMLYTVQLQPCLRRVCETLAARLQLPLVRVLKADVEGLHEVACSGEPAAIAAVRSFAERVGSADSSSGAAAMALGMDSPSHVLTMGSHRDPRRAMLIRAGLCAAAAWPLKGRSGVLLLEVFAQGARDLIDEPTATALHTATRWIARGLSGVYEPRRLLLLAGALEQSGNPSFITDIDGTIVWANGAFSARYGLSREAVIGKNPRILQSGKHGAHYYEKLWEQLRGGRVWSGETVDRTAEGETVTVRQTISPLRTGGRVTHFLAIHSDISSEAQLRAIGELSRGVDDITGLSAPAAMEEHCRQALETARVERTQPVLLVLVVETRGGGTPALATETAAYVRAVIGERLRTRLPPGVECAALGDWSFAALAPQGIASMQSFIDGLRPLIRAPLMLLADSLDLSCRFGVASFPADGDDFDALRRRAEQRLVSNEMPPAPAAVVKESAVLVA